MHSSVQLTDQVRTEITQDNRTTVTLDELDPLVEAFGTREFVVYQDAALARPIDQEYVIDGKRLTMRKDAAELKKAQYQLEGHRVTIKHPDENTVSGTEQVRGVTRDPWYDDETDTQRADVYLPATDEAAIEYADSAGGISVGFTPTLDTDVDDDGVDAVQRDLLYDHVAIVPNGRCSIEDGCGLFVSDARDDIESLYKATCSDGPCTCGGHVDETLCVVDASETPPEYGEKGYYPIGSETDLSAAWEHLTEADLLDGLAVDRATVESRFQAKADDLDVPVEARPWADDYFTQSMTDADDFGIELEDLGTQTVVDRHDGVAEEIESLKDDKQTLADERDSLESEKEDLESTVEELHERLADSLTDEYEEKRDALVDAVDIFEADDLDEQWTATDSIAAKESFISDMDDKLALVDAVTPDENEEGDDTTEGLVTGNGTVADSKPDADERAVSVELDQRGRADLRGN